MKNLFISSFLLVWIGTVDQIHDDIALVEVKSNNGDYFQTLLSTLIFPCELSEGDMFYFGHFDGVAEVRCGEPPD